MDENGRRTVVQTLDMLLRMGYTEDSARNYLKTGDLDKLKYRQSARLDGTETR